MAIDENFLMKEILKLNTAVAGISGNIDGFLRFIYRRKRRQIIEAGKVAYAEGEVGE
ncbi:MULTISPECIES: hypothetical protein [Rhizobium]|uniref:Uncharacterized protein n=1 Tax=Rhizobium aethiopicum TaxID=1138170 RepID=A0A1C3Y5Y9_9HYPH|nr:MULTISPECIES: hypothetical protein [Rhizobium]SCB59908.1 hypothetical protein GA0061105_108267 [Rhizobium aethiopicum]